MIRIECPVGLGPSSPELVPARLCLGSSTELVLNVSVKFPQQLGQILPRFVGCSYDDPQARPDEIDSGPRGVRITAGYGRQRDDGIIQGGKSPLLACRRRLFA